MANAFRAHLAFLEKQGKLLRVKKEVDPKYEISAGIRKTSDTDGPALLFENVKGYPNWKVVGGLYSTQKLIALALAMPINADDMQITQRYIEYYDKRIKPKLVSTGPVKEVVIKGDDVDLTKLPVCTHSELDLGPYITAGVEIARHPDTGEQNVSIHRRRVVSKSITGLRAGPQQHLGQMVIAAEGKGQGLGVATVLGVDPPVTIASQFKAPTGVDEIEIAGAIKGEPIEVVKCETIDVNVPAHAEIVIEGVITQGERVECGPFGEYPGNYISMLGAYRVTAWPVKVTAITMRKDPIYHAMLTGMPSTEDHCLARWALAGCAFRAASKVAEVVAVNSTTAGGAYHHFIVSIRKRGNQDPRNVIYSLWGERLWARRIIVVDDDIDVFDPEDVEWAIATRVLPASDILIIPPVSKGLDEPSHFDKISGRWSIDATMPLQDRQYYQRIYIPGIEQVDYL